MSTSRKALMWLVMLNKRLYKKPSFIVILALILVLTTLLMFSSKEDSGILNVALYAENTDDDIASSIIDELVNEKSIINYKTFSSEAEAYHSLEARETDALWIFPADMNKAVDDNVQKKRPIIKVVEMEDNVFLRLSREKLYSKLYDYISPAMYINYMNGILSREERADYKKIRQYYDDSIVTDSLIKIEFNNTDDKAEDLNHLTGPMRGMLSVMILLCSLASLMYFKQDKANGLFAGIPPSSHMMIEFVYVLIAAVNVAAVSLLSLCICGLFTSLTAELLFMMMYVIMCSLFCVFLGEMIKRLSIVGAMLPVLTLMTLALCPVFINLKRVRYVQNILPTYHYLKCFSNPKAVIYSIIYILIGAAVCFVIRQLTTKR